MGINLDKLREEHEKIEKKIGNVGNEEFLKKFIQIKDGTNTIRILPAANEEDEFYAKTSIHRIPVSRAEVKKGKQARVKKNYHCRKIHGEECPLCNYYYSLWETGKEEDEALAKFIKPRDRYYMNVVDRKEEAPDDAVKILSIGMKIFEKIIFFLLSVDEKTGEPEYGDITDLKEGRDFIINKVPQGEWPDYSQSIVRPKVTPAGTKQEVAIYMENLHDIKGLVKLFDYDEGIKIVEILSPGATAGKTSTPEEVTDENYEEEIES